MNHEIQNSQADQKKIKTIKQAETAFAYNILLPDFAILVIGLTGAFGVLLTMFS
ncbi:MAG: hypothetical protein GKR92_11275 [Gammaproteobacteria bacterium]|nr:MAG: hypothetical protein GKR92_11275 [Gammaproteobacteria bacterium]